MESFDFKIQQQEFWIEGKQELLLCGEIHYFRMEKAYWGEALDKLVQSGCNAVAYYVPWFVHEYEEGRFDFEGKVHPSNNLLEWMRLTREKGLLAIFRPGPYIYAECTDLGIPGWFTKRYPNAQVQKYQDGKYVTASAVHVAGHNHPDFLAATGRWYKAVCEVLRPNLAPEGNIVMVQLCNEIPADDHNDHNPENLGIGRPDGRYGRYLGDKYGSLEMLNRQYSTGFTAFETVEPYMLEQADPAQAKLDRLEFYYNHYYPEYFRTLREYMEQCGIQTNYCHNAYNPRAISLHLENRKQNPWLNLGVDCYFSLNGSLNVKDLTYYCEYGAEYSRRFLGGVPFVLEQECGYWNDYPQMHGPELYIWNLWTIAAGYRGFNMYLFASGQNRPGMGFYGTSHNWQAPVDQEGKARPSFAHIRRSIEDIRRWRPELTAPLRYDIALGIKNDPGLIWKPVAKTCDELYFALRSEGFTPQLANVQGEDDWMDAPAMVLAADERMDAPHQQRLADYVAGGGRLLLCGALPRMQMDGSPCTLLADAAGMTPGSFPVEPANQQIIRMEGWEYYTGAAIQAVEAGPKAVMLGSDREGKPALWSVAVGKGMLVTAPFEYKVVMQDTAVLLRLLLQHMGVLPAIRGQHMLRTLLKEGGRAVVVNPHPVPVCEELTLMNTTCRMEMEPYSVTIADWEET